MKRLTQEIQAGCISLCLFSGLLLGWANVNPSGDIQAYIPGGGSAGNSNVINGDFTVNGNQTVSGTLTAGSVANSGNATVAGTLTVSGATTLAGATNNGNLAQNGNVTTSSAARLILNPNFLLYPSSIDFGTDATGAGTGTQAIVMGPVNPNSVPGPNTVQIGSGSLIQGGGDRNVCVGAKCFIYTGLRSTAVGSNAACASDRCVAIGFNAGSGAVGAGQFSISIGNNSTSYGTSSVAVGPSSSCGTSGGGQTFSSCLGPSTVNPNSYSTAIGQGATVTADHQIVLGTSSETVVHPGPTTLNGVTNNGNQTIAGALTVTGATTLNGVTNNGNQTIAGSLSAAGQASLNGNVTLGAASSNYAVVGGNTRIYSPSDGMLQVTKSDGSFASLLLGALGGTTGVQLVPSSGGLQLYNGTGGNSIQLVLSQIQASGYLLGNSGNGAGTAAWFGSGSSGVKIVRHPTDAANVYITSDNGTGTGFINLAQYTVAKTANYTLLVTDNGTHFTNDGATGAITLTLPTAKKGLRYVFTVTAAQVLNVTGAAGTINAPGNLAKTTASMDGSTAKMSSFEIICWDGANWEIRATLGSTITYS